MRPVDKNSALSFTMATDGISDLLSENFTLIAQDIICAYPISDTYAPAPRYLYYTVIFLTFATFRYRWLSHIFLGAAVSYAAGAAIHAFIIVTNPTPVQNPQQVSIPYISPDVSSLSDMMNSVQALVTNVTQLTIQPDAVELDIDAITAIVVTAYLVGLPLQVWSRTMRSSNILRYMILSWNLFMLGGAVCALVAWPSTNLASPQFRFCYAGFLDPESQMSIGWDSAVWKETWNTTTWNIFQNPETVWQALTLNCFYPCFNTSQTIRQSSSLKTVVATPETKFAKLHNPTRYTTDEFQPLVYAAIIVFSVAQFFLYFVTLFRIGSEPMRKTIHGPHHLWKNRKDIWHQLTEDGKRSMHAITGNISLLFNICRRKRILNNPNVINSEKHDTPSATPTIHDLIFPFRLVIDVLALITLIAGFTLFPIVIVAFICWIEWYIRNDGATNETINQVGQWYPLVSLAVVLLSAVVYQARGKLASRTELKEEILSTKLRLRKLEGLLEKKMST